MKRKLYEDRKQDLVDNFIRVAEREFVVKKYPERNYYHAIDKMPMAAERRIEFNADRLVMHFEIDMEGNILWEETYDINMNDNIQDIFDTASEDFMYEMDALKFSHYY